MVPSRYLCLALALFCGQFSVAQTVVNSIYIGQCQQVYSDPNCWMPAEVPNNTASRQYNVTIPELKNVNVNVSATVSNLNLMGYAYVPNVNWTVTGTTTIPLGDYSHLFISSESAAPSSLNAGTLSTFSANTLRGRFGIHSEGAMAATLQFNGADIITLSEGSLSMAGALAKVSDEFGNDGLRNLARIDSSGELALYAHNLTIARPFTNDGTLSVGDASTPTIFAATVNLTNFDPADRTLRGGKFFIPYSFIEPGPVQEIRFNGADIVNNGSIISLGGANSRIADLAGNDGLRNFAHNLSGASFYLYARNFTTLGSFRNDGLLSLQRSTFTVTGSFANFDPATRTLSGGLFELINESVLRFGGADIVRNGSSLTLIQNGGVADLSGGNGLRNFSENLATGTFIVGPKQDFSPAGNFANAGRIETMLSSFGIPEFPPAPGTFTVNAGFAYTQTAGTTVNNGILNAENVNIFGGTLSGSGWIKGNVTVSNAVAAPEQRASLDGDLALDSGSHLHLVIGPGSEVETWYSITGKIALGGSLDVEISDQAFLASDAVVTLLQSDGPMTGSFVNAPNGARVPTVDGKGSFVIVYEANALKLTQFQANPPPAQLFNISSRAFLFASGDPFYNRTVLIGGFIVTGTIPKKVALRGIGPSLTKSGVAPVLTNPVLELRGVSGALILANDDWKDTQAAEIMQSQLAPGDDRESVIITTLAPAAYTVVLKEKSGLAGNGLVEVYDLSQNDTSKLANISTRGYTDSSNVLIGGIIIGGGQANAEIIVRAIGPSLRRVGIYNALDDPTLELRDKNGTLVAFNDDWGVNYYDFLPIYELAPASSQDSGFRLSLPAGNYTAIVRAKANSGGVALVEFYDLRR
jgi:hypothetical protein